MKKPNTFTSSSYKDMWCRHALICVNDGSCNRSIGDNVYCIGESCPALVKTQVESDEWVGYCGADHPMYIMKD